MHFTLNFNKFLGAVLLAAFPFPAAFAQTAPDTSRIYELEAVSVHGSRVPLTLRTSARIVTVLDSLAIATLPAQSVNDLLKHVAGVDVRQRGDMGVQTDIGIRGGTFNQIAVLLNGINIGDPQTGHNVADFPVDLGEIDRIEVLQGPAGRVYGTSSLVGAINVVTKVDDRTGGEVRLEGGSFGYFNGGGRFALTGKRLRNQVSASYTRSDGYTRNQAGGLNSDYRAVKAFYQGSWSAPLADVSWHAGLSDRDFGSNTFYLSKFDDQYEKTRKLFFALQGESKGTFRIKPALYWNHSRDRFELFRDRPDKYAFNHHRTHVFGGSLTFLLDWKLGKTAAGTEIRYEDIVSTNLGEPLPTPRPVKGSDAQYKVGLSRTNYNLFLEHNVIRQRWTLSAGVIAAKNSGYDEGFRFYPGADASFRISDAFKVYASCNASLRMPTFTELYYSVGDHEANRRLKAEKMQAVEGGVKFLKPGFRAVASVYWHHAGNLIDWVKDLSEGPGAPWKSVNNTVNSLGEELSLSFDFPGLLGRKDYFLQNLTVAYSHIGQDKTLGKTLESKYAMQYLRHKLVAQVDFQLWKALMLGLSARWQDRVGNYERYDGLAATGELVPYKPYTLLDARLSWDAPSWRAYLSCNNVLNKTYYDYGNIPQPGLWIRGGVVFRLRI